MKNLIFTVFFTLPCLVVAQVTTSVGTRTLNSGVVFQVDATDGGFLMPRVELSAANIFAPVAGTRVTGITVYNTQTAGTSPYEVTPGVYFWDETLSLWRSVNASKARDIVKYRNNTTNIDFNDGTNFLDIFNVLDFNQNTALFQKIDNNTLRINDTGLFKLTLSLDMIGNSDRDIFGISISLSGVTESIFVPTAEEGEGTTQTIDKAVSLYVPVLSGGADLKIQGYRINGSSVIKFKANRTSSVVIERIK